MKKNHNRLIRVFVSSTFSDMNNERNYLMTNVFPQLKEIARRRNVTFVELDLRWGIPDEDTRNGKVLQTCLDAIRDSKPFFIGIVGNRVGWCPTMEEIKKNPTLLEQYPEIVEDIESGASVTEMEMQNAVLRNKEKMHAYFYFRNHSEPLEGKIMKLRGSILKSGYPVSEYTTPEEFGEMVKQHFCKLLDELYPDTSNSMSLYEHDVQMEIIHSMASGFIDYNHMEELILTPEAEDFSTKYWTLVGETGIGKSSLMAYWTENNLNRFCIIPCFIGSTHLDSSLSTIKEYLRKEINRLFDSHSSEKNTFEESLKQIPQEKRIVFVIDGIENLNLKEEDLYTFLSTFTRYSQSCKVFFSLENKTKIGKQLHKLKAKYYELKSLTEDRLEDLGYRHLSIYKKERFANRLQKIALSRICENPLLFKTILNELIAIGTNETINELIDEYTSVGSAEELYDQILVRFEKSYGKILVSNGFGLIINSPSGLSEAEITEILNPKPIEWSQFYYASVSFFTTVNGCLVIDNPYLKTAIERRYIEKKYWAQKTLTSFFEKKLGEEMLVLEDGKDAWKDRALDIIKMELTSDIYTIENYVDKVANYSDLLGRINRYVLQVAYLAYTANDYVLLSKIITSPLCYLSLEINHPDLLSQCIRLLRHINPDFSLLPLLNVENYPERIADLIFPDICYRVGDRLKDIMHDTQNAEKAYELAIDYWNQRGYSVSSDYYVFVTFNHLMGLYLDLREYDKFDALYHKVTERFFAKEGWAPENKAGIVANYIRSLENRGQTHDIESLYMLAFSFVSEIENEELRLSMKAQILHNKGNACAEKALYERQSKDGYDSLVKQANDCLCEAIDINKELAKANPYKYHQEYLESRHDLALLHHDIGNNDVAISIFESIITELKDQQIEPDYEALNIENEIVLHTLYSLSFLYDDKGEYDKAEKMLDRVYKVRESQYAENAVLYAVDMANCSYERARLYSRMGKDIKLVEYYYKLAIDCYSMFNEKLPEVAKSYSSLAYAYQRVQLFEEALRNYKMSRETWKKYAEYGFQLPESTIAEIYFQEAQCALACNDRDYFSDCMMKSFDLYEKLSQSNPDYNKELHRLADFMDELLKANGLK